MNTTTMPNGTKTALEVAKEAHDAAVKARADAEKVARRKADALEAAAEAYRAARSDSELADAEVDKARTAEAKALRAYRTEQGRV